MKKILFIAVSLLLCSCADFLDVNPKGEVFDNDMFVSAEGYEDALYGIYAELGTETYLYSDYMYWIPEALSIDATIADNGLQYMALAQWYAFNASSIRNGVWKAAYAAINHINNIIKHIEADNSYPNADIYRGEALALRAMLHFDLLRFYGAPVWAGAEDKAKAIPYVNKYSFNITAYSSVDQAYAHIIEDLKTAESLLAKDETLLPEYRDNSTGGGFTSCRIIHLNLYAVKALLSRVYWSMNDLDNAALYASEVIGSGKFRFRDKSAFVQYDNGTLDLNETIFGIYSKSSNEKNAKKWGLTGSGGSFTLSSDWKSLYRDGSSSTGTDYRESAWFDGSHLRVLVNNAFIEGSGSYTGSSIPGVNILRISEMYFIMAESLLSTDPDAATAYYDAAVTSRGLDPLTTIGQTLTADILYRERRKEFYGEGLHWHDMKRLGKDIQADPATLLPGTDVNTYKIPVPISEDANREEE